MKVFLKALFLAIVLLISIYTPFYTVDYLWEQMGWIGIVIAIFPLIGTLYLIFLFSEED